MSREELEKLRKNWEKRRFEYESELVSCADPARKFSLKEGIKEFQAKIQKINAELENLDRNPTPFNPLSSIPENPHRPLEPHIRSQYTELQKQYNDLAAEIDYLCDVEKTENLSRRERYNLRKQIESLEEQQDRVNQQLIALDKVSKSEQLYRNLLKLGYQKQVRLFLQLIQTQSVAAFLIHGSSHKYGQRWLLNRLVDRYVPHSMTGRKVKVELSRTLPRSDVKALWRELGDRYLGLRSQKPSPSEIAEGIYRWWQTENVLLVFHDINLMPKDYVETLIRDFWNPLAHKARNASSGGSREKLLMFLVDYDGSVGNLAPLFSEKVNPNQPAIPVRPPTISKFDEEVLADWIANEFEELPIVLKHNFDDTVREILSESEEGIPEYVLAGIFKRCGYDYYQEVERLWKL
ncbi:MAG: hypothetical protein SVX43_02740 [Cyanobacteriota bacterium]|nr:hypothetical protein [Cyanobacteriota bacterium]